MSLWTKFNFLLNLCSAFSYLTLMQIIHSIILFTVVGYLTWKGFFVFCSSCSGIQWPHGGDTPNLVLQHCLLCIKGISLISFRGSQAWGGMPVLPVGTLRVGGVSQPYLWGQQVSSQRKLPSVLQCHMEESGGDIKSTSPHKHPDPHTCFLCTSSTLITQPVHLCVQVPPPALSPLEAVGWPLCVS